MKRYSLRRATLVALVVPMLLALATASVASLISARRTIDVLRDHAMQQEAGFLLVLARREAAEGEQLGTIHTIESSAFTGLEAGGSGFRIWSGDRIITSAGALSTPGRIAPPPGLDVVASARGEWRRFALHDQDLPIVVEVAEPLAMRDHTMWRTGTSLIGPLLALVIAVCLIATWRVAAALRPLARISDAIRARHEDDLSPLTGEAIPDEVAPLVDAVNDLMVRLETALQGERAFSSNAAHELRTPLAALKTRSQLVQRALATIPGQEHQVTQLLAATDRATAVIDQLLVLSRLQSGAAGFGPVDLSELAGQVARDRAGTAMACGHTLEADIAPHVMVRGNADALEMLVANLLENAIKHSPPGGRIDVRVARLGDDGAAVLRIADCGPGIADDRIDQAFDRFTRFGTGTVDGTGLGLSIVRQIAISHGATVRLRNRTPDEEPGRGLEAEVLFAPGTPPGNAQR